MAQKWEYKAVPCDRNGQIQDRELIETLNDLGNQGWEIAISRNIGGYTNCIIMKRLKDEKFPKVTKEMERQAEIQINEEEWPDVAFPRK